MIPDGLEIILVGIRLLSLVVLVTDFRCVTYEQVMYGRKALEDLDEVLPVSGIIVIP